MFSDFGILLTLMGMTVGADGIVKAGLSMESRFQWVSDEAAWKHLPKVLSGDASTLPNWAKILCSTLPTTTAAMLELDDVQRTKNTLDPQLRAKIRWVAARANGCEYTRA